MLADRGFKATYFTVSTADKWQITFVRIDGPGNSNLTRKPVFFLDSVESDATYWAHHQIIYDLYDKGYGIWLGNTRYSKGFNLKMSAYSMLGTINELAIHDIPA